MVKRLFLAVSCSFRLPAFFGLVFPLLEGLSFLGFVWYPGLYCYLLGRFFPCAKGARARSTIVKKIC